MRPPNENLPEIYVQPGESCLATAPAILRTLLGSCVGIVFWVPEREIGALCHPMLPRVPTRLKTEITRSAGRRYVDYAIRDLARELDALGVRRDDVEVKLFGGGDVLLVAGNEKRPTIGKLNSDVAVQVLEEEGFTIMASSLRGDRGINIYFNTRTGEVLLQRHT